ncbi:MAG: hypothetical protein A2049_05515 [Elusimicrobia bacterium GWA2_62_23]|nr:MAG: hypothetical protein A2049_05515 [Elusimicrobia bacterium GWA2_62_23]OGR66662.1 MAG: hypothetical protein A2179_01575 [Elusimicrobia bacterium GWC2_63_65]
MEKTFEAEKITLSALNERINKGARVQLLDVRDPKDYPLGVIKDSKKIPLADLEARYPELDKAAEIVTYCSGPDCDAARKAAELLSKKGFRVIVYTGGFKEWKMADLPMETGTPPPAKP